MPKVYVIIVTYNAMKWTERCFSSLRKSSVPLHTIVVDNGSSDGTQDYIRSNFPEVQLIQSETNGGFGKANNTGIEIAHRAGADFFYIMNQDAWIFEDSVQKLIDAYTSHPEPEKLGILSPMHLDGTEKRFDLHFENYLGKETKDNRLFSDIFAAEVQPWYEINFVNAAHWLIPRKIIEKIGGFNPYFFHGAEDYEYINRVLYFGLKVVVCPHSKVVHDAKVQSFKKLENEDEVYNLQQRRLSIRMQRETRYLNPAYHYNIRNEKKEFYSNIIKLRLKGNKSESDFYLAQYKYFQNRFQEIEDLRKISLTAKHPFLNLD